MKEQTLARRTFERMATTPTTKQSKNIVQETNERVLSILLRHWLDILSPGTGAILDTCVTHADKLAVFNSLFHDLPGTLTYKFHACGEPPLLAHMCGHADQPLTDRQYEVELNYAALGRRPEPERDMRTRQVVDPLTGQRWASVIDAARAVGCAESTMRNHLCKSAQQPTIAGRTYEYAAEEGPPPGSIVAMSEDEREALRVNMRAMGWEPKF